MAHLMLSVAADRYTGVTYIGEGGFSVAFQAVRKADGKTIVVKETDLQRLCRNSEHTIDEWREKSKQEYDLMAQADHPNIVKALNFYVVDHYSHLAIEFCDAGALKSVIVRRFVDKNRGKAGFFPEDDIWNLTAQLVRATRYLHKQLKILHRDIKSENIFLTHDGQVVKLGDFGISKQMATMSLSVQLTACTPHYTPPETVTPPLFKKYSKKSEIWTIGIVMFELARLRLPFEGRSYPDVIQAIIMDEPPQLSDEFSSELHQLITNILCKDPDLRPTIDELWEQRRVIMALQRLAVKFPHLRIDLTDELPRLSGSFGGGEAGWLVRELQELNKALVRELDDKEMSWQVRLSDFQSELEEANSKLAKVTKELAEKESSNSIVSEQQSHSAVRISVLESELAAANAELEKVKKGREDEVTTNSSLNAQQVVNVGGTDNFKNFAKAGRTFYRSAPSNIVAILSMPTVHCQAGSTNSETALVIICEEGQIISFAPPNWTLSWRNNVELSELLGDPKFYHAAYDTVGRRAYINHSRSVSMVLALECIKEGQPQVAIDDASLEGRVVYGLAIASEQRSLLLCNNIWDGNFISMWKLPVGDDGEISLISKISCGISPRFCALAWQGPSLIVALSGGRTIEFGLASDGRDWLRAPSTLQPLKKITTLVRSFKEVVFDNQSLELFAADNYSKRIVTFSQARGFLSDDLPRWTSNYVGLQLCRFVMVPGNETRLPRLVSHGADGWKSLAIFEMIK